MPSSCLSLVSSLAQQLDIGLLFLLFLYILFLSSVWSFFLFSFFFSFFFYFLCRPYFSPSAGHITGLIVPANSNFVPQGLNLRPQRMFASFLNPLFSLFSVSSLFLFFVFIIFPFFFFSGEPVHTMDLFLV